MDPFTQGIVGTTVAQSGAKKNTLIIIRFTKKKDLLIKI